MSSNHYVSKTDEITGPLNLRPHLVLLGAGASRAAFPDGDANGIRLPVMSDFVETVGLDAILDQAGVKWHGVNFEALYSDLVSESSRADIVVAVQRTIEDYFSRLQLPPTPTLYDYILLSLRSKDVVATFNWDPFLIQAAQRVGAFTQSLPKLLFLHGNVAHGHCHRDAISGPRGAACARCGNVLTPDKLLYPVAQKDYSSDRSISTAWDAMRTALNNALCFTIFGYGAPATDKDAVDLMSGAWGDANDRQFEEIEIVDIRHEGDLYATWERFIHTHHYKCHQSWHDSFLFCHPRRSIEAFKSQFVEANFTEDNPPPQKGTLDEIFAWFKPLLAAEKAASV